MSQLPPPDLLKKATQWLNLHAKQVGDHTYIGSAQAEVATKLTALLQSAIDELTDVGGRPTIKQLIDDWFAANSQQGPSGWFYIHAEGSELYEMILSLSQTIRAWGYSRDEVERTTVVDTIRKRVTDRLNGKKPNPKHREEFNTKTLQFIYRAISETWPIPAKEVEEAKEPLQAVPEQISPDPTPPNMPPAKFVVDLSFLEDDHV